jgi:cyclopropane fatty-acyl-phospholipid synthase-like methyltransferase
MGASPDRERFNSAYTGQPPWDISRPQRALLEVAGRIAGSILDVGCGTGENALYFAARGHQVTGVDFLAEPIARAKRKAAERGVAVTFLVMDALELNQMPKRFDSAIDSGLFHVFSDEDRLRYVEGLATILKPGGRLFLICFSDAEPPGKGPRRVAKRELRDSFSFGWEIELIEPTRYEVRPDLKEYDFSEGGPKAWFMVARRGG